MTTKITGKLFIRPQTAKLKHKTEAVEMNPYVRVVLGSKYRTTHSKVKGGKNPIWDDKIELKRTTEEVITFEIWDKDIVASDTFIGLVDLDFNEIIQGGNKFNDWLKLRTQDGKEAGVLLVSIEFFPEKEKELADIKPVTKQPKKAEFKPYTPKQNLFDPQPTFQQRAYSSPQQSGNFYPSGPHTGSGPDMNPFH